MPPHAIHNPNTGGTTVTVHPPPYIDRQVLFGCTSGAERSHGTDPRRMGDNRRRKEDTESWPWC
jgi:hypothetical protein